jgi:hypothetical protein
VIRAFEFLQEQRIAGPFPGLAGTVEGEGDAGLDRSDRAAAAHHRDGLEVASAELIAVQVQGEPQRRRGLAVDGLPGDSGEQGERLDPGRDVLGAVGVQRPAAACATALKISGADPADLRPEK